MRRPTRLLTRACVPALLAAALAAPVAPGTARATEQPPQERAFAPQLVRVATPTEADVARLQGLGLDLTEHGGAEGLDVVLHTAAQRRRLESELVYTLRQMEGVNDARVKLAMPPKTFFRDDQVAVKASVFLDLAKTYQMTPEVAQGIASLVSHSVPELQPENVTLLNSQGKEIDASAPDQLDVVSEREVELQKKLQGALARIFGERVHTVVNVEYDTSHEESRRWTPGDPKHEGVIADSSQLMEEFLDGESKEDGKKYGVTKKAVNYVYSQNSLVNVRMQPKIDRITATVMVDGASEEELAAVAGIVTSR